jgi:hypothetical protein
MRHSIRWISLLQFAGCVWSLTAAESQLVEAEDFQFSGAWFKVTDMTVSAQHYLQVFPAADKNDPVSDGAGTDRRR